jgi:hypothetical protein
MIREIDVRAVLPAIHVPTLVIQRLDDRINPPCHGRYLASHIAGARYFEQPGDHSLRFAASGDSDALFAEIAGFLAGAPHSGAPESGAPHSGGPDRVLATILLITAPGPLAALGTAAREIVHAHRGRLIKNTGQAALATFDAPGHAIRCAAAVRDSAATAGIQVAAGVHTGEIDLAADGIAGTSVQIADAVAALAEPAEILVSRTVKDLLAGSGISFTARGSHRLTGAAGKWPLFAVARLQQVSG